MSVSEKTQRRLKIKMRIRKRIEGTSTRPRLAVYKSNTATYAQLIDDAKGHTLAAFSSRKLAEESLKPVEHARLVGLEIAKKALEKGIETVVFDRSGYIYHGRVKAVAEGARSGGLKF